MPTFRENLHLGTNDPVIGADEIADHSITQEKLACGSVGACQIIDGEVTEEKLSQGFRNKVDAIERERAQADQDLQRDVKDIQDSMVRSISVNGGAPVYPNKAGKVSIYVQGDGSTTDLQDFENRLTALEERPSVSYLKYWQEESPESPSANDLWYDGTNLKTYVDTLEHHMWVTIQPQEETVFYHGKKLYDSDFAPISNDSVIVVDYWNTTPSNPLEGQYKIDGTDLYQYNGSEWVNVETSEKVIYVNNEDPDNPSLYKLNGDDFIPLSSTTDLSEIETAIANINTALQQLGNEIPTDATEITGQMGEGNKLYIRQSDFEPNKSYIIHNNVWMATDIVIPSGTKLYVDGLINGNGHSLTGQSTKFNAPYQKIFDNVTISGTWDCLAKPDWFGAKSDNENYGEWPLVFYGSTLSSTPTTSTDGPAVVNPNAFIDESLAMVAEVDAMSASPSAEDDQAKLALIGKVRPKHVVYCTDSQKFVLHYNNTYYSSWANSSLWNDAQTGKARTDTLFFCMNDVGGWPVADGPAGFTQINAHRYSGDAHAPVAWTDGLSDGSLAFSKAVAMTKGRLSLKKDGTYYLATLRNINSNTLSYLELYNRDDVLIEGNGATLLFAPQVVNSVTPRRAVNVMKCKNAVIRDINFTSVCDKAGFAYGKDNRYQSGGYRLLNLAASNLLGVFQADCVETDFEDIRIRKMSAFDLRQESAGQINKHTVIRRADIREAPNVIYVSELENLLVEDSYLETMPLNSPGGHVVYRAGGSPSGQTAHDVVVRGSVLKAPDATTNCLLHGNIPEYAGKTKLKLENCTLFCNRVWQGFGGNVLSLVDSNVKRTVRYQAGDKLASLTIPSLFTGAGSLYFRDSSIQSYVAGTVSDAPIHNMDDSYGISRRPGMVFHAVNTTFNTIATGYAVKFNGDIYVDHCVLNGTNSTAFFRNLSPRNVVIRCSEAKVGQQLIEMQQCKGDCTIEDNMVTFSSTDACRLLSTAAATLHRHVVRSNALVAESSNVDVANVRRGGSVYSNTLNGTSGDLYSYDETDGLDDVKDTLFGGVQPDASGLLAERAGICPSTAGTVYYATDEGKYYQAVSEGTPCGVWISFTANGNTPDAAQGFNTVPVQGVVTMTTADGQLIARATLDSAADGKTFSTLQDIRKYVMDKFAENYSVDSSGIGSGGEGNRYGYVKVFSKGGLNAGATVSSWVLTTSALPGSATAGLKGIAINKYIAKYAQGADATWEEIPSSGLVGQVAWLIEKVNELINA